MSVEVLDSDSNDSDIFVVKQIKPINKLTIQQALIIKHGVLSTTLPKNKSTSGDEKKKRKSIDTDEKKSKKKKTTKSVTKISEKKKHSSKKSNESNDSLISEKHQAVKNTSINDAKKTFKKELEDNENNIEQNNCEMTCSPGPKSSDSPSKITAYFSPTKLNPKAEHIEEKKVDIENVQLSPGILRKRKKFQMFNRSSSKSPTKLKKCAKKIFEDNVKEEIVKKYEASCSQNFSQDSEISELLNFDHEDMFSEFSVEEKFPVEDLLNIISSHEDLEEEKCKNNSELLCFLIKKIIRDETKKQMRLEVEVSENNEKPEKLLTQQECEIFEKFFNLKESASKLYVRMLCRKKDWHRMSTISYKDISDNLLDEFNSLQNVKFVDMNIGDEDLTVQMDLLSKSEIQLLCKAFNLSVKTINFNKKIDLINLLISETKKQKSVLDMMQKTNKTSRFDLLKKETVNLLGVCVKLNETVLSAFNKIMLLFSFPHYTDEEEKRFSNQLYMCINVFRNVVRFPKYKLSSTVIFKTRSDFEKFRKALELQEVFEGAIAAKRIEDFAALGNKAEKEFKKLLNDIDYQKRFMSMDSFLQKFSAGAVLARILTRFCDTFKKKRDVKEVIKVLKMLLDQKIFLKGKRGKWYNILSHAYESAKECNSAAKVIIEALEDPGIDEVQKMTLQLKGQTLIKKKTNGITEIDVREKLDELSAIFVPEPASIEIRGRALEKNRPGLKCVYIEENENGKLFTSVEERAVLYYKSQGFDKGYHTEGYIVQTIYFLLFFDIIYGVSPAGVFQSPYQLAPLDFYSQYFYINRKDAIDSLLNEMCGWTEEILEAKLRAVYYKNFNVTCLISWQDHFTPELLCDIIKCITMPILALICQRFAQNFRAARAGFPDLTLWNSQTKKCKFVEVKSPNDKLSPAQRLWLDYLKNIGLDCEVCNVRNISGKNFSDT